MTFSRNITPFVLAALFAVILLALIGANAWSHEKATEAAQASMADTTDTYEPIDDEAPVSDAIIEKVTS